MLHAKFISGESNVRVGIEVVAGFPAALNELADQAHGARAFLRAAWYGAGVGEGRCASLLATRPDGSPIAAVPTVPLGPPLLGVRSVPGSYWPFRSILIADDATQTELDTLFQHPLTIQFLAPAWRVGPVYANDAVTRMVKRAAARAGWTVLRRNLGKTFLFDLAAMRTDQLWPRKSTRRRLAGYERQLAQHGAIRFQDVSGTAWNDGVLDALAAIERNSWVGRDTDGSGAKFLSHEQRDQWRRAIADPIIANTLSATLLFAGDTPVAFSFDLRAGDTQYSIASSYDAAFAPHRPGKIVTYRQLENAAAQGVTTVDLGAGDSGYKQEIGAKPGSDIVDLLIVRSRSAAQLLRLKWGRESMIGRDAFRDAHGDRAALSTLEPLLAAGVIAAAALAFVE